VRPKGDPPEDKADQTNSRFVKIAKYTAIGLQFPSTIIGGLALGYLVDKFFGTSPWGVIMLTFVAFVTAVAQLIQWVRRFATKNDE
jgi:ATP synthase protein I